MNSQLLFTGISCSLQEQPGAVFNLYRDIYPIKNLLHLILEN